MVSNFISYVKPNQIGDGISVDINLLFPAFFATYGLEFSTLSTGLSTGKSIINPLQIKFFAGDVIFFPVFNN